MNKIINEIGITFLLLVLLLGCVANKKTTTNKDVFEKKYRCDSIINPTYNFSFEDDSAVYSPIKKEPFNFKIQILKDYMEQNNIKYYYLLAGINIDTVGLISITEESYLYKNKIDDKDNAILFSFEKDVNSTWKITEDGYFNNYKVILKDVSYNETINDTLFNFSYNFIEQKLPNGYYFENFVVSKQYGIMSFSLSNGVKCNCLEIK